MPIFQRITKMSVIEEEGLLKVTAYLCDNSHEMQVLMVVESAGRSIQEVRAQMLRVPYPVCQQALEQINLLVGLTIEPGINRQVQRLIGGTKGCVHLVELLRDGFKAAYQASVRSMAQDYQGQQRVEKLEQLLQGTCVRYHKIIVK